MLPNVKVYQTIPGEIKENRGKLATQMTQICSEFIRIIQCLFPWWKTRKLFDQCFNFAQNSSQILDVSQMGSRFHSMRSHSAKMLHRLLKTAFSLVGQRRWNDCCCFFFYNYLATTINMKSIQFYRCVPAMF